MFERHPAAVLPLSPLELAQMKRCGAPFELLDVRNERERRRVALEGARALEPDLEAELIGLPKDTRLVFVCHHGVRSRLAAQRFALRGFARVYTLEGGLASDDDDEDS
jgi:monothiol glutaredoxin